MNITFHPEEKTVGILIGETILDAAHRVGVDIVATCGGKGRCNSCRILVLDGEFTPPTDQEKAMLGEHGLQHGFRLGCQTKARSDCTVRIVPPISERSFRILSKTERQHYSLSPDIAKRHVCLPALFEEQQSSDFEEIQRIEPGISHIERSALQHLPALLHQYSREVTLVTWESQVIAIEPGDTSEHCYGLAFDVGSTTVVGYLFDLRTGKELAVASELNAQALYGGDLMSRISFAQQDESGLQKLHERIIDTINRIIKNLVDRVDCDACNIYELTIVGNSCMHHLLLGISPVHLGLAPYLAAIRQRYVVTAAEVGIQIAPQARVVMLPLIAGFVGADTVGVILATGMHKSQGIKLAIDIGTNGEIVLGSKKRLIACSTAAGTAFEGAQITFGMRGAAGAIDRVAIDDEVRCHVIGEGPAQGICGSGVVDAIAQMLDAGVMTSTGRLLTTEQAQRAGLPEFLRKRLRKEGKQKQFILLFGDQTEHGEPIVLTQQDIRELQLAKGAIAAGITMLMTTLQIELSDLHEILLAGAFGNYIDTESAVRIGLIPPMPQTKIRSVGNAAGSGSQLALLSGNAKQEADRIADQTEHIALTNDPEFQRIFASEMTFPENVNRNEEGK